MIELKKCYCSVKVTIVYSLALYFRLCILFPVIGVFLCFIIHSLFYLHVHTLHNNYKKKLTLWCGGYCWKNKHHVYRLQGIVVSANVYKMYKTNTGRYSHTNLKRIKFIVYQNDRNEMISFNLKIVFLFVGLRK